MKFIELASLKAVNTVMYPSGLGGTFVNNCLNIADSGFPLDKVKKWQKELTLAPVREYHEDDMNPYYHSGKKIFNGVFVNPSERNMERFLWDCEIAVGFRSHDETRHIAGLDYFLGDEPRTPFQTIYFAEHALDVITDYDGAEVMTILSEYAQSHGVKLRYVISKIEKERHLHWAYERGHACVGYNPGFDVWRKEFDQYLRCLDHKDAVVFDFGPFLDGDIDHFVNEVAKTCVCTPENLDIVRERAQSWYDKKVRGRVNNLL